VLSLSHSLKPAPVPQLVWHAPVGLAGTIVFLGCRRFLPHQLTRPDGCSEGRDCLCTGAPSPVFCISSAYPQTSPKNKKADYNCIPVKALPYDFLTCHKVRRNACVIGLSISSPFTATVWIIHIQRRSQAIDKNIFGSSTWARTRDLRINSPSLVPAELSRNRCWQSGRSSPESLGRHFPPSFHAEHGTSIPPTQLSPHVL